MKNIFLVSLLMLCFFTGNAQSLNNYRYVIVPESFEFSDSKNEYQLNALTKFLLQKYGFETVMKSAEKPAELQGNPCKALYADVMNDSGLFVTKLTLVLRDCYDKVVFQSEEGRSREKDFKTAFHEALRDAFTSLEEQGYDYSEAVITATPVPAVEGEVASDTPQKEQKALPEEQEDAEVEVVEVVEEEAAENAVSNSNIYVLDNAEYYLEETADGYAFYQKGMAEPFAALIKSEKENSFIYSSINKQGLAYFDEGGDLVVEFFDRNKNKTVKAVYTLQD
ncbi:hypothetical protein RM553_18345 [Zunongwangia sp. F363]|uniref:Secreted protein n=1 Tax=Autumnicola tepida TaxID=3075595 RepID=A0ABU3CEM1_9FLAO|nr:hypothetical protein [Zunongwangia sp. F363]MDT0644807.1 hypothetical protein [Zunongwangia sp. F363]